MTENVNVRFARPDDLEWCVQLDKHVGPAVIQRKIEQEEILIAEAGGEPVGYLRLEYLWSLVPYIALIWVLPEHRRKGVGRAILGYLEEFLREEGYRVLLSSSQANEPQPQAWHRHMGFEECGYLAGINEGGIGEVFFRKHLM